MPPKVKAAVPAAVAGQERMQQCSFCLDNQEPALAEVPGMRLLLLLHLTVMSLKHLQLPMRLPDQWQGLS